MYCVPIYSLVIDLEVLKVSFSLFGPLGTLQDLHKFYYVTSYFRHHSYFLRPQEKL